MSTAELVPLGCGFRRFTNFIMARTAGLNILGKLIDSFYFQGLLINIFYFSKRCSVTCLPAAIISADRFGRELKHRPNFALSD